MRHQDEKYDEFFRAHYDELLRFADKRLRCHQDAEDVAIRAMTTLWEQSLKNPSLLNRAWLFGVLKKLIFAELRRDKSNDKAVEKLRNR